MAIEVKHDAPFNCIYRWKKTERHKELHGLKCRVLAIGPAERAALVEFEDGRRVVVSMRALRQKKK